jgi:hypothetical protein
MSEVHDLSTLINIAVLYDELFVLGRHGSFMNFGPSSDLIDLLYDKRILQSEALTRDEKNKVTSAARKHLLCFLEENDQADIAEFGEILTYSLSPDAGYVRAYEADSLEEVRIGENWFRTAPEGVDLVAALKAEHEFGRSATFFARTFLYLGYADARSMPLVVDSARASAVSKVIKGEDNYFRSRILNLLQDSFEQFPRQYADNTRRMVSPFAAIVFDRCNGVRSRIAPEVERLRAELTEARRSLATLEWDALWAPREDSIAAETKFEKILEEIARSYGPHPGLFSLEKGISFANDAIEVAEDPASWKAWLTAIGAFPHDLANRLVARRPVAEIHDLRMDIPGPLALRNSIDSLFGPVIG